MADRYVKLDDVISIIKDVNWNLGGLIQHLKEHCPTDDVVPKSEVERLQEDVDRLNEINEGLVRELSELRKQIELDKRSQEIDKIVRRRLGDLL